MKDPVVISNLIVNSLALAFNAFIVIVLFFRWQGFLEVEKQLRGVNERLDALEKINRIAANAILKRQEHIMAEKHKDIVVRVYPVKITGTDPEAQERGITQTQDWRNPDVCIEHKSYTVYVGDEHYNMHSGPIVPDWNLGWSVRDNTNGKTIYEGKGEPPWWIAQSLRDGLTLEGLLILRDNQMHG